jgi:hypothetical protein
MSTTRGGSHIALLREEVSKCTFGATSDHTEVTLWISFNGASRILFLLGDHNFHEQGRHGSNNGSGSHQDQRMQGWLLGRANLRESLGAGFWFIGALGLQLFHTDLHTGDHGFFRLADPDAGIIVLLIRLVGSRRIADLALQVIALFLFVGAKTIPIRPLRVCVMAVATTEIKQC